MDLPPRVRVTVRPNGPVVIQGDVDLVDREGVPLSPPPAKVPGTIKLCTCRRSAIHPFCDGSHKIAHQRMPNEE